jgi:predicted nucleotidyltransferase
MQMECEPGLNHMSQILEFLMGRKIPIRISKALTEAISRFSALYAQRQYELVLFGSYARGDFSDGSDIDLLLLLDQVSDPQAERERYFPIVCDLSLKYDTVISVVSMDRDTYQTKKTPLILNVLREGVRV